MDRALRNRLWDFVSVGFLAEASVEMKYCRQQFAYTEIWVNFFETTLDAVPMYSGTANEKIRKWYFEAPWNRVYDFITFLMRECESNSGDEKTTAALNGIAERFLSAYRWVGGAFVPVVDDVQISAIETALATPLDAARGHLSKALRLLSDRDRPDAENSVKESISAVEAVCSAIVGRPTTLGAALSRLKDAGLSIHPALEEGWKKIYGYTSDADGIRHALKGNPSLTVDDALYFLVSCSAFVSLLASKAKEAGIALS